MALAPRVVSGEQAKTIRPANRHPHHVDRRNVPLSRALTGVRMIYSDKDLTLHRYRHELLHGRLIWTDLIISHLGEKNRTNHTPVPQLDCSFKIMPV